MAVPTSRRSAAFCTITIMFGRVIPIANPSIAIATITRASGVLGLTAASPANPTAPSAKPVRMMALVRPSLRAIWPPVKAPMVFSNRNGVTRKPEAEASAPRISWKNSGSRKVVPSSPTALRKASITPRVNTISLNMRGGRIGSGARRSCHTRVPNSTMAAAIRPTIGADHQGYSDPPQLNTSRKAVTPPVSRAAPI